MNDALQIHARALAEIHNETKQLALRLLEVRDEAGTAQDYRPLVAELDAVSIHIQKALDMERRLNEALGKCAEVVPFEQKK